MKYIVTITPTGSPLGSGRTYEIEIGDDGRVKVGDKEYQTDMRHISALSLYSLLVDHRPYEVHVQETDRNNYRIMVSGQGYEGYEVRVLDERTHRLTQARGGAASLAAESAIKAPIPGLIVRVNVQEGDEVQAGQSLVILAAMKMENELRAPRSGVVATVKCKPGESVNQGDVLVTLH
ncbi:MAG: acetyl-CoA carboxylase biotin carboxyl carrier protein subunit [Anaerolineae bacterium]|nr:acetyl-CoA carboxylase biotin carboxyl carrier protein subunit [Anaerolineae bacterium]